MSYKCKNLSKVCSVVDKIWGREWGVRRFLQSEQFLTQPRESTWKVNSFLLNHENRFAEYFSVINFKRNIRKPYTKKGEMAIREE